jgi:hypothetical protein
VPTIDERKTALVAASPASKRTTDHRHLAEPITTVITGVLPRTMGRIRHGSAVVSRRLSLPFHAPGLLISGSRRVDQRRQLGITVIA